MTSRIDKTIARQQEKIAAGAYYEAHQQLRVIAARYLKQSNYDAAAELLTGGSIALLKAGAQQGAAASGGDLAIMLVLDVYNKAEWKLSNDEVGKQRRRRLIEILHEFPPEEYTRKRYITEIVSWSSKFGDFEKGDPEIHHAIGSIYAEENEVYDAERHLALGTLDSAETLAQLQYRWYTHDDAHTAGIYAARAVFPFLLTGSLRKANKSFSAFKNRLSESPTSQALGIQEVSSKSNDARVYPSLPLMNFINLLLLGAQRGKPDLFRLLLRNYAAHIQEVGDWDQALAQIGELYFGIPIPKQSNPLMDMMGMFFGGDSKPKAPPRQQGSKQIDTAPAAMDLD